MKKYLCLILILVMAFAISGCGAKDGTVKYKLMFSDSDFESEKTEYAAGEKVTVRYDIIATDTDYWFTSDDVEFKQDYDGGYVFTFVMPDHDVTLNVESRNSMEYDPDAMGEHRYSDESVIGPYGEITVMIPDNWEAEPVQVDEDKLMYGLYGLILKPVDAEDGQMEIFCTDSFGVCGTGLVETDVTLARKTARMGTYDNHENWDYVVFGDQKPQIVAQHTECDSWTDQMWDDAYDILNTVSFDPDMAEGGIGQYISESEDDSIAVMMSVTNVTPTGLVVHFRQYDKRNTGDLIYGEGYSLERLNGDTWEPVPTIIEDWAFTDEGYTLPAQGEADMETDWSWLYGTLPSGTYRITKTFTDSNRNDPNVNIPAYPLKAQFIIVG